MIYLGAIITGGKDYNKITCVLHSTNFLSHSLEIIERVPYIYSRPMTDEIFSQGWFY